MPEDYDVKDVEQYIAAVATLNAATQVKLWYSLCCWPQPCSPPLQALQLQFVKLPKWTQANILFKFAELVTAHATAVAREFAAQARQADSPPPAVLGCYE